MAITSHLIENDHYELVPSKESDNAWNIRFLKGDYVESVVSIGTIKVGEEIPGGDDHQLTFDFNVSYSPDDTLTEDDEDFQEYVGKILLHIIEDSIKRSENKVD
jgi:hypothetical protein